MPNIGIASIGANIDAGHEVYIADLIRKRGRVRDYVTRTLLKIRPDVVGLSSMAWQYKTCLKLARLVRRLLPAAKIVIGGDHATLMYEEIAASQRGRADRLHRARGRRGGVPAADQRPGRQGPLRGHPVAVVQDRGRVRAQPRAASCWTFQTQAAHPGPAPPDRRLPHHDQQGRGDRNQPGLHPHLQLLQHAAHVRPHVPALPARAHPGRHRRHLHQPPDALDLRGRRQLRARPGARDGDLRRRHRAATTAT